MNLAAYGDTCRPFVKLSIIFDLFMFPSHRVVDVFSVATGTWTGWNLLRGFSASCSAGDASAPGQVSHDREITGSFLAFLIKPLYYMAFREASNEDHLYRRSAPNFDFRTPRDERDLLRPFSRIMGWRWNRKASFEDDIAAIRAHLDWAGKGPWWW